MPTQPPNLVLLPKTDQTLRNDAIVKDLEQMLEKAKAGKITAIALGALTTQGNYFLNWHHNASSSMALQGIVSQLLFEINHLHTVRDEEADDE